MPPVVMSYYVQQGSVNFCATIRSSGQSVSGALAHSQPPAALKRSSCEKTCV
jgi:hypothetical protein